jgi:hypothetical protein
MPEYPLLEPPRTSDRAATTDEPLAAGDRAGGIGIPAGVPNPAARYLLGEEIARGGMGVVYRATDTVLGRKVAVKVLQEKYAPDSGTARRFADEARIAGQLQHPNIPAVHDFCPSAAFASGNSRFLRAFICRSHARFVADDRIPSQRAVQGRKVTRRMPAGRCGIRV